MSIEKRRRRDRQGRRYHLYRVRYRDAEGTQRSMTLPRGTSYEDAVAMDARLKLLKRTGELQQLDRGRETLADFVEEWWELYAGPNLARSTLSRYAEVWNKHGLDRLGHFALRELTPETIARFRSDLERAGAGAPTIRKALSMLQGVLARAVEWQRIGSNPVAAVRKPRAAREREVTLIAPESVERIRAHMIREKRHDDATLVSVLAYAGLRPWSEAIALTWGDVRDKALQVYAPKTRRRRTVDLLAPLRQDLAEWRLASGRPAKRERVFPGPSGSWADHDVRNWRRRVWSDAVEAAGLDEATVPYDLRHAFASLLIHEGRLSIVEIAEQLGHAPSMCSDTYGHAMRELRGEEKLSAEEQIRRARAKVSRQLREAV